MKNWPSQEVPQNFQFTNEQRFRLKPMPRDVGRIPVQFVLGVVYRNQPCAVDSLWEICAAHPKTVLDSRRHLRSVLKQAREEGYVTFEKDPSDGSWQCALTRDRFEEVKAMVQRDADEEATATNTLREGSAADTTAFAAEFQTMSLEEKKDHVKKLQAEVTRTTDHLRKFQRTTIDYLPYTDLNGKVNFMWWYETKDVETGSGAAALVAKNAEEGDAVAAPVAEQDLQAGEAKA